MDETERVSPETKRAFWLWLGSSLQFAALAALAIFGAAVASAAAGPGDYDAGLILAAAAIVLGFLRLKHAFDGGPPGLGAFLLVDGLLTLWVAVPVFTVLALAGLFTAYAWQSGSMYAAGLGLFVVSAVIVFLDLKRVFDRLDSGAR